MLFLILKVTMSCIQKAEPPKRRSIHKAEPPCYGVFNIKGYHELHTEGGAPKKGVADTRRSLHVMVFLILKVTMSCIQKAEPPKRRSRHKAEPPCYGVFNIKGHHELHTEGGAPKKA